MPSPILCVIVYILIWWTLLFAVLPLGARPEAEPDPVSGWRGGTSKPAFKKVIVINTILTTLLWIAAMVIISHQDWLSFRHGYFALPDD